MKRSSLPKRVGKFTPKKLYDIHPWILLVCSKLARGLNLQKLNTRSHIT